MFTSLKNYPTPLVFVSTLISILFSLPVFVEAQYGADPKNGLERNGNNVKTLQSSDVTDTGAELKGFVEGKGNSVDWWFEWGTKKDSLKNETPHHSTNEEQYVWESLNSLMGNTTYFYRLVSEGSGGKEIGETLSFQTRDVDGMVGKERNTTPIGGSIITDKERAVPGQSLTYTILYSNRANREIQNITFQIKLPDGVRFQEGENTEFHKKEGTLVYTDPKLSSNEKRAIQFSVEVGENITKNKEINTIMTIFYKNPNGKIVEETASVSTPVDTSNKVPSGVFASGVTPFLPNSLVEWLILFLVFVILVLIMRQVYALFDEKKRQKKARKEAENHMQQMRDRMNDRTNGNAYTSGNVYERMQAPYGFKPSTPSQNPSAIPAGGYNEKVPSTNEEVRYYGQNGYGPNGQPMYGPAPAPREDQDPKDKQGNGHTLRNDYQRNENEWKKLHQKNEGENKGDQKKEQPQALIKNDSNIPGPNGKQMIPMMNTPEQRMPPFQPFPQPMPMMTPYGPMYAPFMFPMNPGMFYGGIPPQYGDPRQYYGQMGYSPHQQNPFQPYPQMPYYGMYGNPGFPNNQGQAMPPMSKGQEQNNVNKTMNAPQDSYGNIYPSGPIQNNGYGFQNGKAY